MVAYILRCQAINKSRDFITYKNGKYRTRRVKVDEARSLLNQLKPESKIFDKATKKGTMDLMKSMQKK